MRSALAVAVLLMVAPALAQSADQSLEHDHKHCSRCEAWNEKTEPFRIFGNTWYVGTTGLSAVLITGPNGHILLDGALPQSAVVIAENIRKLGFDPRDVRLIVNSHAHYDHAGGIRKLQSLTGAQVAASAWGARALESGGPLADDPQFGFGSAVNSFPSVMDVREVADQEVLKVGELQTTAHLTPGHTPGSTTWTWKSCEGSECVQIAYADSLNPVSAPDYRFTASPKLVDSFRASIARVASLPCDILISVHPESSLLFEKHAAGAASPQRFRDATACRKYAASASDALTKRIARELQTPSF